MNEKQLDRSLRSRFSTIAWSVVIYFGILNILVNVSVLPTMLRYLGEAFLSGREVTLDGLNQAVLDNAWGYFAAFFTGLVVLFSWKGMRFWKQEIWAPGKPMTSGSFFALLALFLAVQPVGSFLAMLLDYLLHFLGFDLLGSYENLDINAADSISMFLYSGVLAPVSEEILFRGVVQKSLRPYGKRFSILGSAFLFAMFHGNLVQSPIAFAAGLILGYVAAEYSIIWCMVLHTFNNLVYADLLFRLTEKLPLGVALIIENLPLYLCLIASIILLIRKREDIRAYRAASPINRRCLKCFFGNFGMIVLIILFTGNMIVMLYM